MPYEWKREGDVLHAALESPVEDRQRWIRLKLAPYEEIREIPITNEAATTIGTWFNHQFISSYTDYPLVAKISSIENNTVTF